MSFEFLWVKPNPSLAIKRLVEEPLSIEVGVRVQGNEKLVETCIVEAWTDMLDEHGHRHAIPLTFQQQRDGVAIFGARIIPQRTGFFSMNFRARHHDGASWTWYEHDNENVQARILIDPAWVSELIVYNAFVRFFGAKKMDPDGVIKPGQAGTFDHLKDHLDSLKKLNINVLYLNPIHLIGELYKNYNPHDLLPPYLQPGCPYSIKDYKSVDPELAYDQERGAVRLSDPLHEFKELVKAAHKRGIRVIMDLVFNHTAHDAVIQRLHPEWYLYKENITDLEGPYIYPEELEQGKPWGDPRHTFAPFDHGYWWQDTAQLNWEWMLPVGENKPPKNPTIEEMWDYFSSIPQYWVKEVGIDGFRCDVAYHVPTGFWKKCIAETREVARQAYPDNGALDADVIFIAETYVDYLVELQEAGFTACYGDYANKLYNVQTLKGYLDYIYNLSDQHLPDGSRWFIFPECHDFHRTPGKIAADKKHHLADFNGNKSRWTLTATLPGIPMIFNGFEKIEWHPVNLFSYSAIDWEADKDITEHIGAVNKIRASNIALQKGSYTFLHTDHGEDEGAKLFSFMRRHGNQIIFVIVNMDVEQETQGTVYLPDIKGFDIHNEYVLRDLLSATSFHRQGKELFVQLGAGDAHIFEFLQG